MYKKNSIIGLILFSLFVLCCKSPDSATAYSSDNLKILSLTQNSFIHISYLNTQDFGKVPCNGLIYMNEGKAVVFDTPIDKDISMELINWIVEVKKHDISAVVINHFHQDCLGGLETFHRQGIPSFALERTIKLAEDNDTTVPQIEFEGEMEIEVGNTKIINRYFGEAHTVDNIVSYIPEEEILFGGCMVKSLNAKKGNLADANLKEWSKTISKIKTAYPDLQVVIPGHGDHGDMALLEYTIQLFSSN